MATHHQDHTNYEKEGWDFKNQKKYEKAISSFEKAIKHKQKTYFAYHGMGECLLELQKYDEAYKCFIEAIKIDDKHPWAYHGAGRAQYFKANYQGALAYFDKSILLELNGVLAWFWKGKTLMRLEKYEQAEQAFSTAMMNIINTNKKTEYMDEIDTHLNVVRDLIKEKAESSRYGKQIINNINNNVNFNGDTNLNRVNFADIQTNIPKNQDENLKNEIQSQKQDILNNINFNGDSNLNRVNFANPTPLNDGDEPVKDMIHSLKEDALTKLKSEKMSISNQLNVKSKTCPFCGEELDEYDAKFCSYCGRKL